MINRLAVRGQLIYGAFEQPLLQVNGYIRNQNHEAGVQRLFCVELPEISSIVGHENKIVLARVAQNIPVFPAGFADVRHVMRFVAGLAATVTSSTLRHSSTKNLT